MQTDFLIIGQGLCGTFLSWYLLRAGKRVLVIDDHQLHTASRVASGVINPVTGKRVVRTWLIDQMLPFALHAYEELGRELDAALIRSCSILDFHGSTAGQDIFEQRIPEESDYLHAISNEATWEAFFRFQYGIGAIDPCLLTDIPLLLNGWRHRLQESGALLETHFSWADCHITPDSVTYGDITAGKIICCDGAAGFEDPYFRLLPYARNKGEVIIAAIPGLPRDHIYKQGISLVPRGGDEFWIGATYEWNFTDLEPTDAFRKKVTDLLDYWLKLPYTIIDHVAAERPANMDRRPFVGLHPLHPVIGILNGMGSKGCSMAPFFASELANHLLQGQPLTPATDVRRFMRILSR